MKKIKNILLTGAIVLAMVPVVQTNTVTAKAENYSVYPINCSGNTPYEVDVVNDVGYFNTVGCYVDFNSAKAQMKASGDDAVVRHSGSYTSNQIIAMSRGFVFSAAYRDNKALLTITHNGASTYIQNEMPMYYYDTVSYDGSGNGTVSVNAFGFQGNIPLYYADFVPQKFFDNNLKIYTGGNDFTGGRTAWWTPVVQNYYTVVKNGNYMDLVSRSYRNLDWGAGGSAYCYSDVTIGPAADWMKEGAVYYSLDDANFYSDSHYTQLAGTYYDYYLYQPLRTKSKIPAYQYNAFLAANGRDSNSKLWDTGSLFLSNQETYGINAAMVFIQGCIESAYGTSSLSYEKNNLFGVAAYDTDFGAASAFNSPADCINNQMGPFLRQYTDTDDWKFYGGNFGDKGGGITTKYASSSTYGKTLAQLYYQFDKFVNNYNGNLTDFGSVNLGIINNIVNVYSDTSESNVLYNTSLGGNANYTKDFVVAIVGESGNYYRVQSTDYIRNGARISWDDESNHTYDWNNMIGYVRKSDVSTVVSNGNNLLKIQAFVTTLYQKTLDREPDLSGLNYWTEQLIDGNATGSYVAGSFIFGSEFSDKNYCNEDYVKHLYSAILGRESDSSGLSYWESQLASGMSREEAFNGFVTGTEFSAKCAAASIMRGNGISVPAHGTIQTWICPIDGKMDNGIGNFVLRLYNKCLGRDAEEVGTKYWINLLHSGKQSGTAVAYNFYFSNEFISHNYNNTDYVTNLYHSILGRDPDDTGLNFWVSTLNQGASRESILYGFGNSAEWRSICASYGIVA